MYRTLTLLAVSVALLAAGALTASSAMAACGKESWCIASKELKSGESAELERATTLTKAQFSAAGFVVKCTKLESQSGSDLDGPNIGKGIVIFGDCGFVESESCKLGSPTITTVPLKSTAKPVGTKEGESTTSPESGTALTTVEVKGETCALAGKMPISGTIKEKAPTGQEEKTEQKINVAENEVKIGSTTGKLTIETTIELRSGSKMALG